jgi:hypothetical protein
MTTNMQRYRLMKLTFYDQDNNVSAVLPCPNCFLASLRGTADVDTHQTVCVGCHIKYDEGVEMCQYGDQRSDEEKAQDPTPHCFCTYSRLGLTECKYRGDLQEYVDRNSAIYTADQVKALWSMFDFDSIKAKTSEWVVGLNDLHSDTDEMIPCACCYGHYFPCSYVCSSSWQAVTLMSYDEYKRVHVACSRLPKTYEEYTCLTRRQVDQMIMEAWDERDNPEGKEESEQEE